MQNKKPTLQDVAHKANVSTATVSRCLNMPAKVKPEVCKKITEAIRLLGYVPHGAARALASRRSQTIGAVVPTIDNAIFSKAIQYLQLGLAKENYTLLLSSSNYSVDEELRAVQALLSRGIDGLVLVGEMHHPDVFEAIDKQRIPYVNIWTYNPNSKYSCIGFDHLKAGDQIAQHLYTLGHKHIGIVSGIRENNDRAILRAKGIEDGLKKNGVKLTKDQIIECRYSIEQGCSATHQLLDRSPELTAICCGNDVLAIGALAASRERGLSVPEDLSITGFDNLAIAPFISPALTTVNTPSRRMGEKAADFMLSQIGKDSRIIERISVNADFIIRETTNIVRPQHNS